jgi:NADH:ubiquinone oxidoreductase subunit 2 (subunit N)
LFYYLRVVIVMYSRPSEKALAVESPYIIAMSGSLALSVLMVFLFWLGIMPDSFIELIRGMIG